MPNNFQKMTLTEFARKLRQTQTTSEGLLWSVLRSRQLCQLKFRRQYPVETFIVDFVCCEQKLVIEIDGEYHDHIVKKDIKRQNAIKKAGWSIIRFTSQEVEEDVEAIAKAISIHLNLAFEWRPRLKSGSGMMHKKKS